MFIILNNFVCNNFFAGILKINLEIQLISVPVPPLIPPGLFISLQIMIISPIHCNFKWLFLVKYTSD